MPSKAVPIQLPKTLMRRVRTLIVALNALLEHALDSFCTERASLLQTRT